MSARYSKTYSRQSKKDCLASKAFDDVFGCSKQTAGNTKTAATMTKWGKTMYTSTRSSEYTVGKRKRLASSEDPFSFDSDDDRSPRKAKPTGTNVTPKKTTRSASSEDDSCVTPPSAFYSSKKSGNSYLNDSKIKKNSISNNVTKTQSKKYSKSNDNKRQTTLDSFTTSIPVKPLPTSPSKRDFDHQYARVDPAVQNNKPSNDKSSIHSSDSDSDPYFMDESDPEILIRSPKKTQNENSEKDDKVDPNQLFEMALKTDSPGKLVKTSSAKARETIRNLRRFSPAKSSGSQSARSASPSGDDSRDSSTSTQNKFVSTAKTKESESLPQNPADLWDLALKTGSPNKFEKSAKQEPPRLRKIVTTKLSQQSSRSSKSPDAFIFNDSDSRDSSPTRSRESSPVKTSSKESAAKLSQTKKKDIFSQNSENFELDDSVIQISDSDSKTSSSSKTLSQKSNVKSSSKTTDDKNKPLTKSQSNTVNKDKLKQVGTSSKSVASTSKDNDSDSDVSLYSKKLTQQTSITYSRAMGPKSRSVPGSDSNVLHKILFNSPKKQSAGVTTGRAAYNPRPWAARGSSVGESSQESTTSGITTSSSVKSPFDGDFDEPPKLTRSTSMPKKMGDGPVSTLRVQRDFKPLYTVVKNVKEAHECQEHGETQEFFDDVEYLLDGLKSTQSAFTRCLSCLSLAEKCSMAAFRMHLRAHGTVTKIFTALHDACSNPSLALATAAVMFMMSRDRLNMDLDRVSLELMVKLLSADSQIQDKLKTKAAKEYNRTKDKIQKLCDDLKKEGGAKGLDLSDISTGHLASEALMSLTSRRAGEWFKEELRDLGGLDHIVHSVADCVDFFIMEDDEMGEGHLDRLRKIERNLKVLENVTFMNIDNQKYLISFKNSTLITALCRALHVCASSMPVYPVPENTKKTKPDKNSKGHTVFNCMLSVLRVLLNVTHDNETGSTKVGNHHGLLATALQCILQVPQYVPVDQRFDLLVLSLGMLINLVEHCDSNRRLLIKTETVSSYDSVSGEDSMDAPEALVQLFLQRLETARKAEEEELEESESQPSTSNGQSDEKDKSGEWKESDSGIEWVVLKDEDEGKDDSDDELGVQVEMDVPSSQEEQDLLSKALHKAGKHMEDTIVASYIALLLGCLIQDNESHVERIRESLPGGSYEPMVKVLHKFLNFMSLTSAVGNSGGKSIKRVIEILEAC